MKTKTPMNNNHILSVLALKIPRKHNGYAANIACLIWRFIKYNFDLIYSVFNPTYRIISRTPLEVFYCKSGHFDDHVISNFLGDWGEANLSATFFALSIKNTLNKKVRDNDPWISNLVADSLRDLYDQQSGGFRACRTRQWADYQSTYYGLRTIALLESEITARQALLSQIGADTRKIRNFMMAKYKSFDAERNRNHDFNLSVYEKSVTSTKSISPGAPTDREKQTVTGRISTHLILDKNGRVGNFKMFARDKSGSISAINAGIRLFSYYNDKYTIEPGHIMSFIHERMDKYDGDKFYSPILSTYNALQAAELLHSATANEVTSNYIEKIRIKTDTIAEFIIKTLNYRGGFMFNSEKFSAPNLYATRIMLEILDKRGLLSEINEDRILTFLSDSYDMKQRMYRCYPYRSWYYFRNI